MDFLDPHKKLAHQRRLFLGYFLIGIALILASIILLFQSYGYDLDRKTGEVIQNGLLFIDSAPEKATIYLNGKENGITDRRLTVPAGNYTVELKRDGYRNWKRTFNLEGSSIERLVYPVLFPEQLTTKDQQEYVTNPVFSTQSPDRHWVLVVAGPGLGIFDVFDSNNPKTAVTSFSLPAGLMTANTKGTETIEAVEWSNDNRHLILKHSYNDGAFEFIMIDREAPASSINLNKHLAINPTTISLRDKKSDQLYLYDSTDKTLKTADIKTKQISAYLDGVINYKSYSDNIMLYSMQDPSDATKTSVKLREAGKDYVLRTGTNLDAYLLDMARYEDHWYVAIATGGKVYIYKDPMTTQSTDSKIPASLITTLIMEQPSQLVFSANTRFIMTQSGKKFAIYDVESNRRYYYESELNVPVDNKAKWMDGHRILLNQDSKTVVFDYDGINQQTLVPILPGTKPMFDRDYTRLYTIAPSTVDKSKAALTITNLKINL